MSKISIGPPALTDAEELLAFEIQNRAYFESWVNARDAGYYSLDAVRKAIEQAEKERQADTSHQFLVKADGLIVGRINLRNVVRPHFNKAELGYRVGEAHEGKGFASEAVAQALKMGFGPLALWRIEATARPENKASVHILEKLGFRTYGISERCFQLRGKWFNLIHFERHRSDPAPPDSTAHLGA